MCYSQVSLPEVLLLSSNLRASSFVCLFRAESLTGSWPLEPGSAEDTWVLDAGVDELKRGVVAELVDSVVVGRGADWLGCFWLGDDSCDFNWSCTVIAGVRLLGATLVDVQLDFAVVALVGEVLPSWLCDVVLLVGVEWPGGVSWVGTVLPADWLAEATLADNWLPCPLGSAWSLWNVLGVDWLLIGRLFPDKLWALFADWRTGAASDCTTWFEGWLGVDVVPDWLDFLLLAEGWIVAVPCLVGWRFDAVLLGLLVASVLAADWSSSTVLAGDLVVDGAEGESDSLDVWTDDGRLGCVVVVDGDWLVWAVLPDDWLSNCSGGVGLLCGWSDSVVVVELFLGETVPDRVWLGDWPEPWSQGDGVVLPVSLWPVNFRSETAGWPTCESPMDSAAAVGFSVCLKKNKQNNSYTQSRCGQKLTIVLQCFKASMAKYLLCNQKANEAGTTDDVHWCSQYLDFPVTSWY